MIRHQGYTHKHNEADASQCPVALYRVDFSYTQTIERESVCELRTASLKLNFQASESFLVNIKLETVKWGSEAEVLEELKDTGR